MTSAHKRITKELNDMKHAEHKDISENISAGPVKVNGEYNLLIWDATIIGPIGTPYAGGIFRLRINFPNNYPFVPPVIKFITKVFHPNINENGEICLDVLKYRWTPAYTTMHILISIVSLLSDPNPDDPLNAEAAHMYKQRQKDYNDTVRMYVQQYAN